MSDIKANLIELTSKLGVNLTSSDTRIKHNGSGEFNISSNGVINIEPLVKLDINSDTVNITAKNFTINSVDETVNVTSNAAMYMESGYFSIKTKNVSTYFGDDGNGIDIRSGNGSGDESGGQINITAGQSSNTQGGQIYIFGGYAENNKGGGVNLDGGNGHIYGDVTVNIGTNPSDERECGRLRIYNGPLTLAVYANVTIRNNKIKNPQKGDMCLVESSDAGDNLIHYYNGTTWKAIQPIV